MASDLDRLTDAYTQIYEASRAPMDAQQRASDTNWAKRALSGAAMGAVAGSAFGGPGIGSLIGGGLGLLSGMAKGYQTRRKEGKSAWDAFKGTAFDFDPLTQGETWSTAMQAAPAIAMSQMAAGKAGANKAAAPETTPLAKSPGLRSKLEVPHKRFGTGSSRRGIDVGFG